MTTWDNSSGSEGEEIERLYRYSFDNSLWQQLAKVSVARRRHSEVARQRKPPIWLRLPIGAFENKRSQENFFVTYRNCVKFSPQVRHVGGHLCLKKSLNSDEGFWRYSKTNFKNSSRSRRRCCCRFSCVICNNFR
jgi:hypothetical protein